MHDDKCSLIAEGEVVCSLTPLPLMANVVYQFTCLRDANSTYIGKTILHLATKVMEHTTSSGFSVKTTQTHYNVHRYAKGHL